MQVAAYSASFLAATALAGQAFAQGTPQPLNWTGYYLGLAVGGGAVKDAWSDLDGWTTSDTRKGSANGLTFGGYAGYGYLFPQSIYAGVEIDLTGQTGSDDIHFNSSPAYVTITPGVQVSARARLGYAFDRLLVFGTAGVTTAHHKAVWHQPSSATWLDDDWKTAMIYGIGADYALTDSILLRVEGLRSDFGTARAKDVTNTGCRMDSKMSSFTIRTGLAFKF